MNTCGDCTECCTVLPIQEIQKHAGKTCENCVLSKGCSIYATRPKSCVNFNCNYLVESSVPSVMRPDKSGIIFEFITENVMLGTRRFSRLDAWQDDATLKYMRGLNVRGVSIILTSFSNAPKLYMLADGATEESVLAEAMCEYDKLGKE